MENHKPTESKLLEESKRLKDQADQILRDSGLVETISTYGEVRFVGSYLIDTLLRPDLDIYVVTKEHDKKKLLGIIGKIFEDGYFYEISFADWLNFREHGKQRKPASSGYYLQPLVMLEDGTEWKLDVWFMTEDQYKPKTEKFLELLKDDKDNEKRLAILGLKSAYRSGNKYVKPVNGHMIYRAVLENGVRNKADFEEFLKRENITLIG